MKQEFRNIAFISYNHRDMAVAKQLHRKLDAWRLPSNLHKAHPELPIRLREIFRDTEGLGAGGDLSEQIKAKLRESKFLIVICSPNSAQSKWVNDEVTYFKELGREKQIIPFIIAGKPYVGTAGEECFTPQLRTLRDEGCDPASANVNENGFDHACVKVISGMLGLDFDTLWQRHRRAEKRKRRIYLALAIFIVLLSIGVSLIFASKNREIREQRNEILSQRDSIQWQYDDILSKQIEIERQRTTIQSQYDTLLIQRDKIVLNNKHILQQRNEILSQRDSIQWLYDDILYKNLEQDIAISQNYLLAGNPEKSIVQLNTVKSNLNLLDSITIDRYNALIASIRDSLLISRVKLLSVEDTALIDKGKRNPFKSNGLFTQIESEDGDYYTQYVKVSDSSSVGIGAVLSDNQIYFATFNWEGIDNECFLFDTEYLESKSGIMIHSLQTGTLKRFARCSCWFPSQTYPVAIDNNADYLIYQEGHRGDVRLFFVDFANKKRVELIRWSGDWETAPHTKGAFSLNDLYYYLWMENKVSIYETKTNRLIHTFNYDNVDNLFWNGSNNLCICSEGKVYEWSIKGINNRNYIFKVSAVPSSVAVSKNYAAVLCYNDLLQIWNLNNNQCIFNDVVMDYSDNIQFGPDEKSLWITSRFNEVKCIDISQRKVIDVSSLEEVSPWSCFLEITKDNRFCITAQTYSNYITVFDIDEKKKILVAGQFNCDGVWYSSSKKQIAFSQENNLLEGDSCIIYDLDTSKRIGSSLLSHLSSYEYIELNNQVDFDVVTDGWESVVKLSAKRTSINDKKVIEGYSDGTIKIHSMPPP